MLRTFILVASSYVLGSLPFGLIISKLFRGIDIRKYGSGSIGSTNIFRVVGPFPAVIVLCFDIGKGVLVILLSSQIAGSQLPFNQTLVTLIAGASVILGHIFPVFAHLRGGKGVATTAGVFLALVPSEFILVLVIFILVVATTGYISLGSLVSSFCLPLILGLERYYLRREIPAELIMVSLVLFFLIFYTHRENIKRLLAGTESKFGKKDQRIY